MTSLPQNIDEASQEEDLRDENRRLSKKVRFLERKLRRMGERAELVEQVNTRHTAVAESMRRQLLNDLRAREEMLAELDRQKRRAEAGIEAKARFIANISHEIRTPMNGVFGMLDLLSATTLTREQRDLLDTARGSADWLLTLINDVLDYSKVEAGQLKVLRVPFDVRDCVDSCISLLRTKAIASDICLSVDFRGPIPSTVLGDPDRIRQVLVNLVGNAIKFTREGDVCLHVRYGLVNHRLDVQVRDTGIGIPADRQALIFAPFSQADSSTTRRFGGTGLGLSISREIVGRLGGDLWVDSIEGEGSTFSFSAELPPVPDTSPLKTFDQRVAVALRDPKERSNVIGILRRARTPVVVTEERDVARVLAAESDILAIVDGSLHEVLKPTALGRIVCVSRDASLSATPRQAGLYLTPPVGYHELLRALRRLCESSAPVPSPPTIQDARRAGRRVLVVEDNVVNQKLACRFLERAGYHADVARDGAEGVERFASGSYDIVLMDCQMPVMSGFEACKRIRNLASARSDVPIVALTASASVEDRARCLEAGMDEVLTKPLQYPRLARMLDEFLELDS